MIFVDASAWFALSVTRDVNHVAATQWVRRNTEPLLTTNYIVDETLTLLRARRWSFTDCSSKIIMERLNIVEAFAFDHHFSQFGAVRTVP